MFDQYLEGLVADPNPLKYPNRGVLLNFTFNFLIPLEQVISEVIQIYLHVTEVVLSNQRRNYQSRINPYSAFKLLTKTVDKWESHFQDILPIFGNDLLANAFNYQHSSIKEEEHSIDASVYIVLFETPNIYNKTTFLPVDLIPCSHRFTPMFEFFVNQHENVKQFHYKVNNLDGIYGFDCSKFSGMASNYLKATDFFYDQEERKKFLTQNIIFISFLGSADRIIDTKELKYAMRLQSPLHLLYANGGVAFFDHNKSLVYVSAFVRGSAILWNLSVNAKTEKAGLNYTSLPQLSEYMDFSLSEVVTVKAGGIGIKGRHTEGVAQSTRMRNESSSEQISNSVSKFLFALRKFYEEWEDLGSPQEFIYDLYDGEDLPYDG